MRSDEQLTDMEGYILDVEAKKSSFWPKKSTRSKNIFFTRFVFFVSKFFHARHTKKLFLTYIDRLITRTREHTKTKTTRRIDGEHSFSREFHITRFAITFVV